MQKVIWIILLIVISKAALALDITFRDTRIPMAEAGSKGLEALLVYPNDHKKHPVLFINHGSPHNAEERKAINSHVYFNIAKEFANKGWAVAIVMRRGYGSSGGGWAEDYGSCAAPNYTKAGLAGAADLRAAIKYLTNNPYFDLNTIVMIGHSAGGFATIALTADNPPVGLKAAICFAPGRGANANNKICNESSLIASFAEMGRKSHIPMLWFYAVNDHFFNPTLARKMLQAFNSNGGEAEFVLVPAAGTEGHFYFTQDTEKWLPLVQKFLSSHSLVPKD